MARPRTPIGTFGAISIDTAPNGTVIARTHYRDEDGSLRKVQASGANAKAAERNLKTKIAHRIALFADTTVLTADSSFGKLVELWLEDLDLEGRIAPSTRELYEWNMRHLVLPVFEHLALREVSVSRVDRFLKTQTATSYSRAKQAKVVLSLAPGPGCPVRGDHPSCTCTGRPKAPNRHSRPEPSTSPPKPPTS